MTNSFYTPTMVAKEFVRLLEQELIGGNMVGTDMSDEFKMAGDTVYVRRQMQYLGQDDNINLSSFAEDVIEGTVAVKMDKTWSNKVTIGALERTLDFDRYSQQVIQPNARRAAERIETSLFALYPHFYHFAGTAGTPMGTVADVTAAAAFMTDVGIPVSGRVGFHPPTVAGVLSAHVAATNVQGRNRTALEKASIGMIANIDHYDTAYVPTHTVGALGGTPLVDGGAQGTTYLLAKDTWSQSLVTKGWSNSVTNVLRAGDVFTISGVNSVHPGTKVSTGRPQTFTVLANANSGASTGPATLTISPPIITSGAFQTVTAVPTDEAPITVVSGAGAASHRQSLILDPNAVTLVSRPLDIPANAGLKTSTQRGNRVTVSVSEWVDGNTLAQNMRFDVLWGAQVLDPRRGFRRTA